MENKVKIMLVRGLAGKRKDQIAVVKSLGLKKVGSITIQPDNDATRGKVRKVSHLIKVI